jgi:hypothetical protein
MRRLPAGTDFIRITLRIGRDACAQTGHFYVWASLRALEFGCVDTPSFEAQILAVWGCWSLLRYTDIMRLRHVLAAFTLVAGLAFAQQVPRPAGEFAISMNNGGQVLLSQYSGKVIVLAFLYTT